MKHGIKKIKFNNGQDANQALIKKLTINFIESGKISTTLSKAKVLKSRIDRLVYKAAQGRESDKNVLLKHLGSTSMVAHMMKVVGPSFAGQASGFTKLYRVGPRQGDNAEIARLEWVRPIVVNTVAHTTETTQETGDEKTLNIAKT